MLSFLVMGLLDRLYGARLQLVAVVVFCAGVALLAVGRWTGIPGWLRVAPISELGSSLVGAALVAIAFEMFVRRVAEAKLEERLREVLRAESATLTQAAWEALAADPGKLGMVAPSVVERIAVNALGALVGDRELARDVVADVRAQLPVSGERWRDVSALVELTPYDGEPASGLGSLFVATVRWEYRVIPSQPVMRFACVADPSDYRTLLRDPSTTSVWHIDPSQGLDASSRSVFEVVSVLVEGKPQDIGRTSDGSSQGYVVALDEVAASGREVTVSYTYRVLVLRHGHLLFLDVPRPAKGLRIRFSYAGAGIRRATAVDYIAGAAPVRVQVSPGSVPSRSVDVAFDGWVFPRSGAAFVWVLNEEARPGEPAGVNA